jgi:hypothetical protein
MAARSMSAGGMRRARRRRVSRGVYLRRRLLAAVTLAAVLAALGLALTGGSPASPTSPGSSASAGSSRSSASSSSAARPSAAHPSTLAAPAGSTRPPPAAAQAPSPGSLPQTHTFPSAASAQFRSLTAQLWSGIVADSLARAQPAFFPQRAYLQLKAIADASADFSDRLLHDYSLDIGAAHALLGGGAATARLIAVEANSSYGHWISPGVCSNGIGYYEMPNARVVYREGGQIRSFGIASMISWRGVWYVVHLGAILRSSDAGTVDEPASGPGVQAYSATC